MSYPQLPLILFPAYGRSYDSVNSARVDWDNGKDFRMDLGPYCSKRDIDAMHQDFSVISIHVKPGLYLPV